MMVFKTQIDKLIEELKDKSDSESFDDEKERILNVEKALELDRLKAKLANIKNEQKIVEEETKSTMKRLEQGLDFSKEANVNLKADYDLF